MEDLIDRQEAINVVAQYFKAIKLNGDICIDGLKMLPSAQPTVKAIPIEWINSYTTSLIFSDDYVNNADCIDDYIDCIDEMVRDWEKENANDKEKEV